jgi:hypothetical protein
LQTAEAFKYLLTALGLILSAASFLVGFLTARRKDRITQTFLFLNEWRSKEYTAARDYVFEVVAPKLTDEAIARGLRGLDPEDALQVRNVSYLLDYAGTAMVLGFIDDKLLLIVIGDSVQKLWRVLGRLIVAERGIRKEGVTDRDATAYQYENDYLAGFEHIAERARTLNEKGTFRFSRYRGALPEPKGAERR